jgi:hypothetical protein
MTRIVVSISCLRRTSSESRRDTRLSTDERGPSAVVTDYDCLNVQSRKDPEIGELLVARHTLPNYGAIRIKFDVPILKIGKIGHKSA